MPGALIFVILRPAHGFLKDHKTELADAQEALLHQICLDHGNKRILSPMHIPKFWAEQRLVHKAPTPLRKRVTLRRWGWSDISQADAQAMADSRVNQALDDLLAQGWPHTGSVHRYEPKTSYNGADGIPIREEILWTEGDDVATRNGYGAVCLNTPDVMIADLDEDDLRSISGSFWRAPKLIIATILGIAAASTWLIMFYTQVHLKLLNANPSTWFLLFLLQVAGLSLGLYQGASSYRKAWLAQIGGAVGFLHQQLAQDPGRWALYRTPAGARAIRLDRTMDPTSEESLGMLKRLQGDPMYISMCRRQQCYRARLTPKPWRLKLERLQSPVWPVEGEALQKREHWVRVYDEKRQGWGACTWIEDTGLGQTDERCQAFRLLHDRHALPENGKESAIA